MHGQRLVSCWLMASCGSPGSRDCCTMQRILPESIAGLAPKSPAQPERTSVQSRKVSGQKLTKKKRSARSISAVRPRPNTIRRLAGLSNIREEYGSIADAPKTQPTLCTAAEGSHLFRSRWLSPLPKQFLEHGEEDGMLCQNSHPFLNALFLRFKAHRLQSKLH